MPKLNMRTLGVLLAQSVGWAWFLIAGVGGFMLLVHQGSWPITNGWFAMLSGISACPLTGWLLKKRGVPVPGYVQFVAALLIMVAGRVAVVVVLHRPFLPQRSG